MITLINWLFWLAVAALLCCAWGALAWWLGIRLLGTAPAAKFAVTILSVIASSVMTLATFAVLGLFLRPKP